eukprot:1185882-Prorocentrum_minimum.AAC.7
MPRLVAPNHNVHCCLVELGVLQLLRNQQHEARFRYDIQAAGGASEAGHGLQRGGWPTGQEGPGPT